MGHILRADRPDGGRIAFDPDACVGFLLSRTWASDRALYYDPARSLWICLERAWNWTDGSGLLNRPVLVDYSCRIVTKEAAREMFREAGLGIPPELEDRRVTEPAGPGPKPLPDRLELILDVFKTHGSGPHRGKAIAAKVRLPNNSALREDLAELRRLEYLDHDGRGYLRTDKPYP
jgi:hypothetical protein